jgi:phenylpropionate dioxygenase-like ring-hydroxylating dioxygenase large terminal subunit
MHHEQQVRELEKLFHYLDTRTTALADDVYRNPVADYTCVKQAAREREDFFRRGPVMIGLSGLLPNPGDYIALDETGVPVLLVRQKDKSLAAFLNVCRHRGSQVASGCGGGALSFSCPYHGWTYGLDGALVARPDERSFTAVERASHGLRPLPVVERDGLIWLAATPEARFDVDALLGGLAGEIAGYGLDRYHHYETRVLRRRLNWKLAVDTFLEGYHIGVLHRETIAPILHSNTLSFDAFGRNLRMILPRHSIAGLRQTPKDKWDLMVYTAIIYVLFHNTVFIMQGDHAETWHIFPAGDSVDESVMRVSLYTPERATTDSARRHWDRNFDLLMATVEKEDFPLTETIQRGFYSGAQEAIVFGRNEPGLQHFHKSVRAALADEA